MAKKSLTSSTGKKVHQHKDWCLSLGNVQKSWKRDPWEETETPGRKQKLLGGGIETPWRGHQCSKGQQCRGRAWQSWCLEVVVFPAAIEKKKKTDPAGSPGGRKRWYCQLPLLSLLSPPLYRSHPTTLWTVPRTSSSSISSSLHHCTPRVLRGW